MTTNGGFDSNPSTRPALSGHLGSNYERRISGGGSGNKEFASPSEVRDVFFRGIALLGERLTTVSNEYNVDATMARVRLQSRAIAKSHRHPTLFNTNRLQVAGVQQPGDILALITRISLSGLTELVRNASPNQLTELSVVAEVIPYDASIERGTARSVVTLFDGVLDDGSSLERRGLEGLKRHGVELQRYGKSPNVYTTSSLPSDESLRNMPWVREVRPVRRFTSSTLHEPQPGGLLSASPLNQHQSLPLPIVGVIDTGIDSSVPWLRQLLVGQESHIPAQYADLHHGSLVGSLAATGGGFTSDPTHFPAPLARLLDIQVLGGGHHTGIDEDDLLTQVEDAVQRYGPAAIADHDSPEEPVIIWNLSINSDAAASKASFSNAATELDRIAKENRILFTLPAGNYQVPPLRGWQPGHGPDNIPNGADRISPPADAALAVSVGSLSDTNDPVAASPADCPSPFSRRGPGPGMLVKPDVVHYGGACERSGTLVQGIRGPYRNGSPLEGMGTSFAAPRVASQLAELVGVLPYPEPDLLKLLLLLSCTSCGDQDSNSRDLVNYYGFGVPESPAAILACNPWECMVLFRGELRPGLRLQTPFPFPPSLIENQRIRAMVRMGLVYTPVLDPTKGAEYCQTNVSASLGRRFDYPAGDNRRYKREVRPIPQSHGTPSQREEYLIEHGWKWSPSKLYERKISRARVHPKELGWRLSVYLLLRRELEERRQDVRQSFWLGIRISDPERRGPIYQEMRQGIESMGLAQPIALRPQITV